jgi:hypothetical protein
MINNQALYPMHKGLNRTDKNTSKFTACQCYIRIKVILKWTGLDRYLNRDGLRMFKTTLHRVYITIVSYFRLLTSIIWLLDGINVKFIRLRDKYLAIIR